MNERSYTKAVAKRLACSKARRDEFVRDLEADIAAARETGEPWEQIERRMGDPRQLAAEFNADLPATERAAGKKRKRIKIVGIVAAVVVVLIASLAAATWWVLPHQGAVEQVPESDPTVALAQEAVRYLGEGENDKLRALSNDAMAAALTDEFIEQTRGAIAQGEWGSLESFGTAYKAEVVQMGQSGVVVQMAGVFENVSINFIVSFDDNNKMSGLHLV